MKKFILILLSISIGLSLTSCNNVFRLVDDTKKDSRVEVTEERDTSDGTEASNTEEPDTTKEDRDTSVESEESNSANSTSVTEITEVTTNTSSDGTLRLLSDLPDFPEEFLYMSGVGGWFTSLKIKSDGSFTGYYMDADMGDNGDDYPNGTMYESVFSGKFTDFRKVSDYEYTMQLESILIEGEINSERFEDGVKIITTYAYGMDNPGEFIIYLPGRPTVDLPEDFMLWISMPNVWSEDNVPETLPFYGLYNVGGAEGFFSA